MFTLRIQERGLNGKLEMIEERFKSHLDASLKAIEIYRSNKNLYTAEIFQDGSKYPVESFDGMAITDRSQPALPPWGERKPDHKK